MNRSIIGLSLLVSAGFVTAAAGGGFTGPDGVQETTVAEAKNLPDDAQIKVTGYLVRSVGDEEYQFEDDTGSLIDELDVDRVALAQ